MSRTSGILLPSYSSVFCDYDEAGQMSPVGQEYDNCGLVTPSKLQGFQSYYIQNMSAGKLGTLPSPMCIFVAEIKLKNLTNSSNTIPGTRYENFISFRSIEVVVYIFKVVRVLKIAIKPCF